MLNFIWSILWIIALEDISEFLVIKIPRFLFVMFSHDGIELLLSYLSAKLSKSIHDILSWYFSRVIHIDGVEKSWNPLFSKNLLKVDSSWKEFTVIDFTILGKI